MKSIIYTCLLTILITSSLMGCVHTRDVPSPHSAISVISLQDTYPALESDAKSWKEDAYLRWARITLGLDYPDQYLMLIAAFVSPQTEFESLFINYTRAGSITHEIIVYPNPIHELLPITMDDWQIDSQEALDLLLDQEGLEFLESEGDLVCGFLVLERHEHHGEEQLVWNLTLSTCDGDSPGHVFLDPITGEIHED